jgi:hypothetical protein
MMECAMRRDIKTRTGGIKSPTGLSLCIIMVHLECKVPGILAAKRYIKERYSYHEKHQVSGTKSLLGALELAILHRNILLILTLLYHSRSFIMVKLLPRFSASLVLTTSLLGTVTTSTPINSLEGRAPPSCTYHTDCAGMSHWTITIPNSGKDSSGLCERFLDNIRGRCGPVQGWSCSYVPDTSDSTIVLLTILIALLQQDGCSATTVAGIISGAIDGGVSCTAE